MGVPKQLPQGGFPAPAGGVVAPSVYPPQAIGPPPGGGGTPMNPIYALMRCGSRGSQKAFLRALILNDPNLWNQVARPPNAYTGPGGTIYRADPGSVMISVTRQGQTIKAQMIKPLAVALGFYRTRQKPVVTRADMKAISRSKRAKKRVERLGKNVGLYVRQKPPTRSSRRSHTHRHEHRR